jgi:hypothetical protein
MFGLPKMWGIFGLIEEVLASLLHCFGLLAYIATLKAVSFTDILRDTVFSKHTS